MPNKAPIVRKLLKAAKQRLTAAEFLLQHGDGFNLDSIYLAGYGVECALKVVILSRTPDRRFAATWKQISSGQKGHDYEALKAVLKRAPINLTFPAAVLASFRSVGSWTTDLRYEVGRGNPVEAAAFVDAAREIVQWAESVL